MRKELTDMFMKNVRPPKTGRADYADKGVRGLILRASNTALNPRVASTRFQVTVVIHSAAYVAVRNMRANGCSQATIAAALGMPTNTFRDVLDRDETVKSVYAEGQAHMHDELVSLLMQQARDGYAPAVMFLLKASHDHTVEMAA